MKAGRAMPSPLSTVSLQPPGVGLWLVGLTGVGAHAGCPPPTKLSSFSHKDSFRPECAALVLSMSLLHHQPILTPFYPRDTKHSVSSFWAGEFSKIKKKKKKRHLDYEFCFLFLGMRIKCIHK